MPVVTGSPDTRRDYTDVRDVVRAYRLLAARGEPGAFNVCSGVSHSARELVAALGEVAGVAVVHTVDPERVRAHEVLTARSVVPARSDVLCNAAMDAAAAAVGQPAEAQTRLSP